jgi:hypothetical protein
MTDTDLYRLVYYSRNRLAGDPAPEIDSILDASQRNNAPADVTGALIFNSGMFAQVLEGARRAIEATFERIQRDPRHGDVQVLAFEPVASRAFPSWSMGFVGRSRRDQDVFGNIAVESGFEERRLEGERIFGIMREIALDEERSAA